MRKMKIAIFLTMLMILNLLISTGSMTTLVLAVSGPATEIIEFKRVPVDLAAQALKAGEIDYYIFGLRPAQAEALKGEPDIVLYYAPAGLVDVVLNPAPAPEGELNPLSIREVRLALNYLMDRDYVVNQIYKGFAAPMVTFLSSYDPDFITVYDIVARYDFKYDPVTAATIIDRAMSKAGATKVDGKWYYNNKLVTLNFIIRIEDERREIGDTFASALESLGFTVNRLYMAFGQAIPIIYGTNPAELQWHLYTEGWGKGALEKYDYSTINQMGAPWFGWMPGWQEAGYWQYENSTIDNIGKRIFMGNFTSKEERDNLYRTATEMIIQESIRIWAATRLEIHPARKEVAGLTEDLGTGLRAPFNPREVYIAGKDTVKVGHLWVHTEASAWNPIGGHDDVYSIDMWRAVYDPPLWRHPFSGMPIPFRWDYEVRTAGPVGALPVPEDAVMWNAVSDVWEPVGSGVTAKSKVTFDLSKYIGSKWHNGQPITWADILFAIYQAFEIAYDPEKSAVESSISAILSEQLKPFKGFRIVGNSLEVYLDYWHFSDDYIADYAVIPGGHYPWEILAAMDIVVFKDKAAMYSESAAESFGVPWLSVNLREHAALVNSALDRILFGDYEKVFTIRDKVYATSAELENRRSADHAWFDEKKHMVISDGPFYLNIFDAAAQYAQLKAFRDPTYPFAKGDWFYGKATPPTIVGLGIPTVIPGGAASIIIDVSGPTPLGVKYLIRDPTTGTIVDIGEAEALTATKFIIRLLPSFTEKLEPGLYELTVAAYSEQVAFVSTSKVYFDVFNILPLESAFKSIGAALSQEIASVSGKIDTLTQSLSGVSAQMGTLIAAIMIIAILAIINTIVMVLGILRKR
ncbi:MAG: ABC transporter substrate-binding protein [Candidatus Bathyarchaeia archaeon]